MTFDFSPSSIPWEAWAVGAGFVSWAIKAWMDKRYAPFVAPLTPEQQDLADKMTARKILATKEFVEAADHQVNTTMMSDRFHQSVEGVVISSARVQAMMEAKAQKEVSAQVSEKIASMGDTQRMMLESLKEIKRSLDDAKLSMARLEERIDSHIRQEDKA